VFLDSKSFCSAFIIFFVVRYYSAEEQYYSEQSHKAAECHLKQVTANLCTIFQVFFVIRPLGTIVREGLMFYCSLFFVFSSRDIRGPWANLREILPHRRKHVQFTNAGPKIWGPVPKKILGAKIR